MASTIHETNIHKKNNQLYLKNKNKKTVFFLSFFLRKIWKTKGEKTIKN